MELAREYDLDSMTDSVPDCEEDLPASTLTNGKITTLATMTASASIVCPGATVTLSGTLRLVNEARTTSWACSPTTRCAAVP
jgi:hypothetical protein